MELDAPLLTDELAARVERLLIDWRATGRAPNGAAQDFARAARELGIGIVDPERHRSWVDERAYEGVLLRGRDAVARAEAAERALAELQGLTAAGGTPALRPACVDGAMADDLPRRTTETKEGTNHG